MIIETENSRYLLNESQEISGGSILRLFGQERVKIVFAGTEVEGAIYQSFLQGGRLFCITASGKRFVSSKIVKVRP